MAMYRDRTVACADCGACAGVSGEDPYVDTQSDSPVDTQSDSDSIINVVSDTESEPEGVAVDTEWLPREVQDMDERRFLRSPGGVIYFTDDRGIPRAHMQIVPISKEKGNGLVTLKDIPFGRPVVLYSTKLLDLRGMPESDIRRLEHTNAYLMKQNNLMMWDGTDSIGGKVNQCGPGECNVRIVFRNRGLPPYFRATRNIDAGEELLTDYNWSEHYQNIRLGRVVMPPSQSSDEHSAQESTSSDSSYAPSD